MSFSALLAKSDSNENILVDVDEKTAESYILIDNDLDKQVDVEALRANYQREELKQKLRK